MTATAEGPAKPAKAAPRKAAARKTTTPKTAPAKAAPAPAVDASTFALDALPATKNWAVFTPPAGSGFVGKLYAPLGTKTIKVRAEK